MLSREVMGLFCLGVVWLTALLVAGAAWQDLRDLRAVARRARRHMIKARVVRGEGEDGCFAEWGVEQTGRALDAADARVAFHDRTFRSRIFGGSLRSGDETYTVAPLDGDVWPSDQARARAASCGDLASFDEAYALSRKAKGFRRDVRVPIGPGDEVWVLGEIDGHVIAAPAGERLIVSSVDPLRFCSRKCLLVATFIPAELAVCAAATRVAWSAPHFGAVSVVGAVLCLAFFLGVTPLAVALRESVRAPNIAYLRGRWTRARV